jgi:hypothetical protein
MATHIVMHSIARRLEAGGIVTLPAINDRPARAFLRDVAFALPRVALLFGAIVALYGVTP